ncbi:eCIS core domain-containing protein [Microcoleus sp. OTE_8_concoct_300]|uniref:eCIS core domain-containing protein n=1 Tax=Microcoleus sp. OTE_8_concoct_300 TaxID=2964710 RepID=UPI00403F75E6
MSKLSGKVQAKSRQTTTGQTASKAFALRPFPEIARKEEGKEASLDSTGRKDIKPGAAIDNINRAIASVSPPVHSPTVLPGGVQAKLTLGAPGDMYEQEADRVARQVVDEIHSSAFQAPKKRSEGERKPDSGEAGRVQRQITVRAAGDAGGEISSEWETQLQGAKSGGLPLSPTVKEPMERAFGADFGGVRVHTGAQADMLARSIQAKAFTAGQDVFFRQGAYEPGSRGGQELIAHELTHVVQQRSGEGNEVHEKGQRRIQRTYYKKGKERNDEEMYHVEAKTEGNAVKLREVKKEEEKDDDRMRGELVYEVKTNGLWKEAKVLSVDATPGGLGLGKILMLELGKQLMRMDVKKIANPYDEFSAAGYGFFKSIGFTEEKSTGEYEKLTIEELKKVIQELENYYRIRCKEEKGEEADEIVKKIMMLKDELRKRFLGMEPKDLVKNTLESLKKAGWQES